MCLDLFLEEGTICVSEGGVQKNDLAFQCGKTIQIRSPLQGLLNDLASNFANKCRPSVKYGQSQQVKT